MMKTKKAQSGESGGPGEGKFTEPRVWKTSQGDGAVNGVRSPESPKVEWA